MDAQSDLEPIVQALRTLGEAVELIEKRGIGATPSEIELLARMYRNVNYYILHQEEHWERMRRA